MSKSILAAFTAATCAVVFTLPAQADDNPWMVRGRVIAVLPDESADLSAGGASLGGDVDIGDQYVPELDITYFFNENIAAELILAVTPHDVEATQVVVPDVIGSLNVDLGDVWLLPPTLTLQYHFTQFGQFKPYVGAGLNATFFFNEDEGPVADGIDYDPSFGGALQVGMDYDLDGEAGGWGLNLDVKKIWINTDVTVNLTSALGETLGAETVNVDADVDINPLVVGAGVTYKF